MKRTAAMIIVFLAVTATFAAGVPGLADPVSPPGKVVAWGQNQCGELGNGTRDDSNRPVEVTGFVDAVMVSGGAWSSLALDSDRTVWAWGLNCYGQLGDGTYTDRTSPVQASGITDVTAVSAGALHGMALKGDGTVWTWGSNNRGQLGDGTNTNRETPTQVPGLADVTAVSAGGYFCLALKSDGTVWSWGQNDQGQLGDGTTMQRTSPVQVSGIAPGTGVVSVSTGTDQGYALKDDGTVLAWGRNDSGALGDGTYTERHTPVEVTALSGVQAVDGGLLHCLALRDDGTVWAWGLNDYGQLGDGTTLKRHTPAQVPGLVGITDVAAGYHYSVALEGDGTARSWGRNDYGQLADSTNEDRHEPVDVLIADCADIDAGGYHCLAIGYNPVPAIGALSPSGATVGSSAFTLTVDGSGFVPGTVLVWNGSGRVTTTVSSTRLTAAIGASDLAEVGEASVFVFNGGPGGGYSNTVTFEITEQPEPPPPPPSALATWYLAEGTTAWGFDTRVTIENPGATAVTADVTFMPTGGSNVSATVSLPARSQTTLTGDFLVQKMGGLFDFSTKVVCEEGLPIAVDRTMEWTGPGALSPEGHSSIGVNEPAGDWYLPEGSTNWGFETWLLIQNPGPSEAVCAVTYMIEGEGPREFTKVVGPRSRESYSMEKDIGNRDASIRVSSNGDVICERAMYRNDRREGHGSIGATSPAKDFFLAEGATGYGAGFVTYVLVQNPGDSASEVELTYMTGSGRVPGPRFTMAPNSRKTVRVNDQLPPNTDVSINVSADLPVVAERAMYWDSGWGEACHDSIGMSAPAMSFYLPDGQTSLGRETWTLAQNPNGTAVEVTVTYLREGGGSVSFVDSIPANSRRTYNMADRGITGRAAVLVESGAGGRPIIVERAIYWHGRGAGTSTIGGAG